MLSTFAVLLGAAQRSGALTGARPLLAAPTHIAACFATRTKAPSSKKNAEATEKKPVKKEKAKKVPSAFNLYMKAEFRNMLAANPGKGVKELLGPFAQQWKGLSDAEKAPYVNAAQEALANKEKEKEAKKAVARPLQAFPIFVKEMMPSFPKGQTVSVRMQEITKMWKEMDQGEKDKRIAVANAAREEWKAKQLAKEQ